MDQMCPNWHKIKVFVSFLKFKPSDSAAFAYSSSFLLSLNTIATKLAEKNFRLKIRPSPNYFNGFWLFSHVFFIGSRWFCTFKLLSTVFIHLLRTCFSIIPKNRPWTPILRIDQGELIIFVYNKMSLCDG